MKPSLDGLDITIRHMTDPSEPPWDVAPETRSAPDAGCPLDMNYDDSENPRIRLTLALVFLLVVIGGIVDLILDQPERLLTPHVLFELGLVLLSLAAASHLARGWYLASSRVRHLQQTVEAQEAERDAWRARASKALASFREALAGQFDTWQLTPTEREVAARLLGGESHKRIARETNRSERTVRQHAMAVYRKSGLGGRAELAGFFLGDLLPPGTESMESDPSLVSRTP